MFETLFDLISPLGHWSYLVIFLAAFLESSAFMGLLVPGESIVVIAGLLASQNYLELGDCLWVVILGAVLGDSVGYYLGKRVGIGYFARHKRLLFLKRRHLERTYAYFEKHGGKTIFLGRFVGLLRAVAPFAAGMSRMPYGRFVVYNITGGALWGASFILLGYFFGHSWHLLEAWAGRVGVFVFFLILVGSAFGYIYKRIIKREGEFYKWMADKSMALISNPWVEGFINRHPVLVSFVRERISPEGYLGLHLTIGFALSVVFVWILGAITEDILTGDPFVAVDLWVLNHIIHFRTPLATGFMLAISHLSGIEAVIAGSLIIIVYLTYNKRIDYIIAYIMAISGGSLLVFLLKIIIQRRGPISEMSITKLIGWSFPSGHATISVIFLGMFDYFLILSVHSWKFRVLTAITSAFCVLFIGMGQMYLEAAYLSDIVAGYLVGLFWLTICITGLQIYKKKREISHPQDGV